MQDIGAGRNRSGVCCVDVGPRLDGKGDVVQARCVELELLLLERLP